MATTPTPPSTSPFAPGERDVVAYQAAPALPSQINPQQPSTIAASPAPTATPQAGSGITCPSVQIAANPLTGAMTDLWVEVQVGDDVPNGNYTILLTFCGSDGVAIKPRTFIVPVLAGF